MSDPIPHSALELPTLLKREFIELIERVIQNPNLGAGIVASGTSGSGKSNVSLVTIDVCARLGIPFLHIDPHGDAARKAWRMALKLPDRLRRKIIYWRVADPQAVASINPLWHDPREAELSEYSRLSQGRILIELTADVILAAVGESGAGFAFRPVLRKWITRWLWLLWRANLTLADASLLIDPHNPIYRLLIQLAPDAAARQQMEALPGMKVADLEAEIGSARNRLATLLEHPAAQVLLSRRHDTIDFRNLYDSGMSLIVDLDRGEILSEEVQRLIANLVLNQYLAVVLSTPEGKRQRRMCIIDELPVFNQSCAPLLEKMSTEIRKYLTSFLFLHQGGARFPGRTDNEFLRTIFDMCRVKLLFRHNIDAPFFGEQVALAAHQGNRIRHVQTMPQQLTVGHEVVELIDRGEGTSDMQGRTDTDGTTDTTTASDGVTDTLSQAVRNADQQTRSRAQSGSTARAAGTSRATATQQTSTRTTNFTVKQTLIPKIVTRQIVTSLQFYSKEEIEWAAASALKNLGTGEAVVMIDGTGVWRTQTPEAKEALAHAPRFAARKLREWLFEIRERPEFASPEQIQLERREFLDQLVVELRRMAAGYSTARLNQQGITHLMQDRLLLDLPGDDDSQVTL